MNDDRQPTPVRKAHLPFLIYISMASALGGLLWGFDAIVISGTIKPVKALFDLSSNLEGLFVSSGLIGAVIGSAAAGWLSDRFGRSRNLLLAAILLWISALGSSLANSIELLILARWLGGLGVGISAMVCPLYIAEISPSHLRGRLVTSFQFAITAGIMLALFSNYGLHEWAASIADTVREGSFVKWFLVDNTWRAMFASELIPGVLFLIMAFTLPESPRWLVKMGRNEEAGNILNRILATGAADELAEIDYAIRQEDATKKSFGAVFSKRYRKPLIIGMLLATFSQFSGINVVFYYGTAMLEDAGLGADSALSGMAIIGFFNMIFTSVAMVFVDKFGRRTLLMGGTVGAIACLLGIGAFFNSGSNAALITLICGFVAFFAWSLGPIKFIFSSEIFPTNIRSHAISIVILTMWLADTLVGQFTPALRDGIGPAATFTLFGCILIPQLFLAWKVMPETAGRSLEEIEAWYTEAPGEDNVPEQL